MPRWECGTRLVVHAEAMQVIALAKSGVHGWIVMRGGGDIRTVAEAQLRDWTAFDPFWEGPEEPLEIPEALRLVIEYLEIKPRAVVDPAVVAQLSPRQKAGLLIRTYGTDRAVAKCRQMPKRWGRQAVGRVLRHAGCKAVRSV